MVLRRPHSAAQAPACHRHHVIAVKLPDVLTEQHADLRAIAELPVDISDRVAKGDLLFRLDDKDLKIEIDSRKKQIDSATLQLEQAKR